MDIKELKYLIKNRYKINSDYVIKKEYQNIKHTSPYFLNIACFKHLCMCSKTKKGTEVREYYIEIENLLIEYKNAVIKQLMININNNAIIKKYDKKNVIYIINASDVYD